MKLVDKVRGTIKRYSMLAGGERVLIAVSGGPDSVALLDLLFLLKGEFRLELIVAHYHHRLRKDADEDLKLVKRLAEKYGLHFIYEYAPEDWWKKKKGSLEEEARRLRYEFLLKTADTLEADKIALGHNAQDRAESFLLNLIRGAGALGLAGMPPVRDKFIRPLIETTREEILEYIKERSLAYRLDRSNLDPKFLRNRVRAELIPLLKSYNPRIIEAINRTCELLLEEQVLLEEIYEEQFKKLAKVKPKQVEFRARDFLKLPVAVQRGLIRQAIKELKGDLRRIGAEHIFELERLFSQKKTSFEIDIPDNIKMGKSYEYIFIKRDKKEPEKFKAQEIELLKEKEIVLSDEYLLRVSLKRASKSQFSKFKMPARASIFEKELAFAFFDLEMIKGRLRLRSWSRGDKIELYGLKGSKKLKDIFQELEVPKHLRKIYPLVEDDEGLVWVPGYGICERVAVRESSKKIAKISMKIISKQGLEIDNSASS